MRPGDKTTVREGQHTERPHPFTPIVKQASAHLRLPADCVDPFTPARREGIKIGGLCVAQLAKEIALHVHCTHVDQHIGTLEVRQLFDDPEIESAKTVRVEEDQVSPAGLTRRR